MNYNYFPGHMAKAIRELEEILKLIDVVIEIRDARAVSATSNLLLEKLSGQKPRLLILSKRDLADPQATARWVAGLTSQKQRVLALDINRDNLKTMVSKEVKILMAEVLAKYQAKNMLTKTIRCMVVGIPNVGKSSFINRIVGKKKVEVANKPGVTRALKWLKVSPELMLLDTPGILKPKFEDQAIGEKLAILGSLAIDHHQQERIAEAIVGFLREHYLEAWKRYLGAGEGSDDLEWQTILMRQRGFSTVDHLYTALIKDFRAGKIALCTLEPYDEV